MEVAVLSFGVFFSYSSVLLSAAEVLERWGHRVVTWIVNKCQGTQKVDDVFHRRDWWTRVIRSDAFNKDWKSLVEEQARNEEACRLNLCSANSGYCIKVSKHSYGYGKFLGSVYGIAGDFGLWMPGVSLVASYLAEKKGIEGLYVCDSLEILSTRIEEIAQSVSDQRCAFIVGTFQSGFKQQFYSDFEPNFPQHKVTVCIEKKNGHLTIALLDAEPTSSANEQISPDHLTGEIWDGYERWDQFNAQELVFRSILKACRSTGCQARLLHSRVQRERSYGCTVFALQDAVAYLRDGHFFDKITCSKEFLVKIDEQYAIEAITTLPSECMIGTQSSRLIEEFRRRGGVFDRPLIGRKKNLQQYLDVHQLDVLNGKGSSKKQNHYITKKTFKYLNLVVSSLNELSLAEIQSIVNKTFICEKLGPVSLKRSYLA